MRGSMVERRGFSAVLVLMALAIAVVIAPLMSDSGKVLAAEDMGPGGTTMTNAKMLNLETTYSGTAIGGYKGAGFYQFRTTANSHVSYIFESTAGPADTTHRINMTIRDSDGNDVGFVAPYPNGITVSEPYSLKKNRTYYLVINSNDYVEDIPFTLKISQVVPKPAKAKLSSVKAGKKKLTVKYASVPYATRYQVQYKKKGASKWKTKETGKTRITIRNLKAGKKYQVRVRAVRVVDGKNYNGAFSKKVTKKVK
ncbi:MAG: fibronectin type III domain-containing protein [Firmicutes bacterium]|nr:fibronectin type III domain-containing protein [Bacillota bacterium]